MSNPQSADDMDDIEMSKKQYDLAVFIGRMQPLHNGHVRNIEQATEIADHVLVIVGSANQPRTPKNPFTANERIEMIKGIFPDSQVGAIGVEDFYPNTEWLKNVQTVAHKHLINKGIEIFDAKIAILGHKKDHTSFYLSQFPTWEFIEIGHRVRANEERILDASVIREHYFDSEFDAIVPDVPTEVLAFLDKFHRTPEFQRLIEEEEYFRRYHKIWELGQPVPYSVTFVTTDAIVVQSGHVLLVKRRTEPGKGLWALPGGFINQDERLEDGVIRELREETRLKVASRVLKGSMKHSQIFDEPNRSLRGRTITHAYLFDLEDQPKLPKVQGADDAEEARWFPLDVVDAMGGVLFEDHKLIIQTMVAKLKD